MDKFFKITERGSSVRSEIVGGVTTFFAMAYIIFVNPQMLSQTGMDANGVMLATCISAAIGCCCSLPGRWSGGSCVRSWNTSSTPSVRASGNTRSPGTPST